jgi:hypothetical protein
MNEKMNRKIRVVMLESNGQRITEFYEWMNKTGIIEVVGIAQTVEQAVAFLNSLTGSRVDILLTDNKIATGEIMADGLATDETVIKLAKRKLKAPVIATSSESVDEADYNLLGNGTEILLSLILTIAGRD